MALSRESGKQGRSAATLSAATLATPKIYVSMSADFGTELYMFLFHKTKIAAVRYAQTARASTACAHGSDKAGAISWASSGPNGAAAVVKLRPLMLRSNVLGRRDIVHNIYLAVFEYYNHCGQNMSVKHLCPEYI